MEKKERVLRSVLRVMKEQAYGVPHCSEHADYCAHRKQGYDRTQVGCTCGFSQMVRAIERVERVLG